MLLESIYNFPFSTETQVIHFAFWARMVGEKYIKSFFSFLFFYLFSFDRGNGWLVFLREGMRSQLDWNSTNTKKWLLNRKFLYVSRHLWASSRHSAFCCQRDHFKLNFASSKNMTAIEVRPRQKKAIRYVKNSYSLNIQLDVIAIGSFWPTDWFFLNWNPILRSTQFG